MTNIKQDVIDQKLQDLNNDGIDRRLQAGWDNDYLLHLLGN
jgi:hypothetical protein